MFCNLLSPEGEKKGTPVANVLSKWNLYQGFWGALIHEITDRFVLLLNEEFIEALLASAPSGQPVAKLAFPFKPLWCQLLKVGYSTSKQPGAGLHRAEPEPRQSQKEDLLGTPCPSSAQGGGGEEQAGAL